MIFIFLGVKENSAVKFVGPMGGDFHNLTTQCSLTQGLKRDTVYKWKMLEVKVEVPKLV